MNRDDIIKDLAIKWVKKAEKDLLTAKRELSFEEPLTDIICFHCQQAVEKYLKSYLVYHQVYFPKTHKIIELLGLCAKIDSSFNDELKEADNLTDYAVEIRYPDLWLETGEKEAREAFEIAQKVKAFVSSRMTLK